MSHALVAISRHRSSDGHVTLDSFGTKANTPTNTPPAKLPHGFRKLLKSDSGAKLAFWDQTAGEEEEEEEEDYHDILHQMDTEQYFMETRQRILSKVKIMEEEMAFLRDDLAATSRDFIRLVQHLQQSGVPGSQDFEMAAPEEPAAWFERRTKQRIAAEAAARLSAKRKGTPKASNAKASNATLIAGNVQRQESIEAFVDDTDEHSSV